MLVGTRANLDGLNKQIGLRNVLPEGTHLYVGNLL